MLELLIGFVAGAVAIWWSSALRSAQSDKALDRHFVELHEYATETLPADQLAALTRELKAINEAKYAAIGQGAKLRDAQRMTLKAAIRSTTNHIELNRMLPG